ncbi:uncharacterized protein LOC101240277 [Hydra vulgaris]|uniref:uncharacterized protein LOC101240277 n=1 Tax=Hydra vulgaris TaxID=6087 RepID=UPI0032E9D19D
MVSSILPEMTLPSLKEKINGRLRTALIDSGCSITVVHAESAHGLVLKSQKLITTLGGTVQVLGEMVINLEIDGIHRMVNSLVVKEKPFGFDLIFGMNAIKKFGGVIIYGNKNCNVRMLACDKAKCGAVTTTRKNEINELKVDVINTTRKSENEVQKRKCDVKNTTRNEKNERNEIKHQDFTAKFDGKKWTASWNWNKEPVTDNTICEYKMNQEHERSYRKEIREWIDSGILVPYNELILGPPKVLIPLMCVVQENKDNKVRPVGDFRALNEFVNCQTANADVCQEKLRCWRKIKNAKILDLKKVYLQIHIDKKLWPYQTLSHASVETAKNVAKHLLKFGLQCKPPQDLEQGRVLGFRVERNKNGELIWKRDNVVQFESLNAVTRSQLFSQLGKLIGHYPVAGSLRLQASYIKRLAGNIPWCDFISEDCKEKLKELLYRVEKEDPVGGKWLVPVNGKAELYCDASSIELGAVLLIGGVVVEDAALLRPASDTHHINISELDSILRGLNLASKWGIKELTVYSESKSTVGWLNAVLKEEYCVKTWGISQLLVQRRLNTIKEVAKDIQIAVQMIPSEINLADRLSQIPQKWCRTVCAAGLLEQKDIWKIHSIGHFSVARTLQLCLRNNQNVSRKEISAVIANCNQCNSIDPYSKPFGAQYRKRKAEKVDNLKKNYKKLENFFTSENSDCNKIKEGENVAHVLSDTSTSDEEDGIVSIGNVH